MSNTLNTPTEALEAEFPLRVRELSLRGGSGGDGTHRGGDGLVREIEALAPMRFTLITERRRHRPRGHGTGGAGKRGGRGARSHPPQRRAAAEQGGGGTEPGGPPAGRNSGRRRVELGHI